jgi:hypothetical protein
MGVKLRTTVNPLEASIENATLKIYFFEKVIKEVNLPIPPGVTLGKQCNFFKTPMDNVFAYLSNDKYVVIIRLDGTLDVLTSDFILLKRSRIDPKEIMDDKVSVCFCGSLSILSSVAPAYLALSPDGAAFLFSERTPVTILLDMKDSTNIAIKDWALSHNDVGTLHIMDNTSGGTALWANFGTKEYIQMKSYKVLSSKGVIGGVL